MDDADSTKKKIVPAAVLDMEPKTAAALVSGLDEANRLVLVRELVGLALTAPLPEARARALGAVFGALGRARLKLHAWHLLTAQAGSSLQALACIMAINPYVGPVITGIFSVPFGSAGLGVRPTMGITDEDREDIRAMQDGSAADWAASYAAMAAKAREAGTLFVEESV